MKHNIVLITVENVIKPLAEDLKTNKIPFYQDGLGYVFNIENSPKARQVIQMVKEKFPKMIKRL